MNPHSPLLEPVKFLKYFHYINGPIIKYNWDFSPKWVAIKHYWSMLRAEITDNEDYWRLKRAGALFLACLAVIFITLLIERLQ